MTAPATGVSGQQVGHFLSLLAARVPAPGGGATAALHAAQAAALVSMVGRYTTGARYADHASLVADIVAQADESRARCLQLADDDAVAFAAVSAAYALPRSTDAERRSRHQATQGALLRAAKPPADVISHAERLIGLAEALLPIANRSVLTDVAAATEAARAAAVTGRLNVEVNMAALHDAPAGSQSDLQRVVGEVDGLVRRAGEVEAQVRASLKT